MSPRRPSGPQQLFPWTRGGQQEEHVFVGHPSWVSGIILPAGFTISEHQQSRLRGPQEFSGITFLQRESVTPGVRQRVIPEVSGRVNPVGLPGAGRSSCVLAAGPSLVAGFTLSGHQESLFRKHRFLAHWNHSFAT